MKVLPTMINSCKVCPYRNKMYIERGVGWYNNRTKHWVDVCNLLEVFKNKGKGDIYMIEDISVIRDDCPLKEV